MYIKLNVQIIPRHMILLERPKNTPGILHRAQVCFEETDQTSELWIWYELKLCLGLVYQPDNQRF